MTEEIVIAGFGGQGVLSMGKILAYSGIMQNLEASWFPSYGPEMRGGTANVNVTLSTDRISNPILSTFDTAILLNQQSIDKFEKSIKTGGLLIYDTNGITNHPVRKDINICCIDAAQEVVKLKSPKTFNMIVLGAFLKIKPFLKLDNVIKGLKKSLPARHHHLIPDNVKAINRGLELVKIINKIKK